MKKTFFILFSLLILNIPIPEAQADPRSYYHCHGVGVHRHCHGPRPVRRCARRHRC